jgi:preprotein translocase subunit SecG
MNKLLKTILISERSEETRFCRAKRGMVLIISIALFGTIFLFVGSVQAIEGLTIQFQNGNNQPLFSEANFLPGESVSRWVEVINETGQTQPIAAEAINFPGFPNPNNVPIDDLSRVLEITISQNTTDLYGGSKGFKSLFNFYEDGETFLSNVSDGSMVQYDFIISFPPEAGNDWQEETTYFDILVGPQGTGDGGTTGGGGTSGGGGGGYIRGLTIFNEADVNATTTSVTITWQTNYLSTSQVIYDIVPYQFDLNATSSYYGYTYSKEGDDSNLEKVTGHSITITGLTPGVDYYYRCVSHGSLAIGTEHSFTTLVGTGEEEIEEVIEEEEEEEIPAPVIPGEEGEEGEKPEEIVEGPTEGEGAGVGEITFVEDEGKVLTEEGKGVVNRLSGGLASIIDALRGIGEQNFLYLIIILILVFIILILLYLLLKKKKKKEEDKNKSGTINFKT